MTDDILLDRIFKYFDSDNDGYIGREEWIMGLSVFLKGRKTCMKLNSNRFYNTNYPLSDNLTYDMTYTFMNLAHDYFR